LVVALLGRYAPLSKDQIADISAIQNVISAVEAVIIDLDTELAQAAKDYKIRSASAN